MSAASPGSSTPLLATLSSIARAASETLDLREVFTRMAEASRAAVPFDAMGVSLLESPTDARVFAVAGDSLQWLSDQIRPRAGYSPQWWPADGPFAVCVGDGEAELDPSYAVDRETLGNGYRSGIRVSLEIGARVHGSLWFLSKETGAYGPEHVAAARPIGDIVSLVLVHDRLWSKVRTRRRKRVALEALLPTLAQSLDLRTVFAQVSRVVQEVIPHDGTNVGLLTPDGKSVRNYASTSPAGQQADGDVPLYTLSPAEIPTLDWDCLLIRDHSVLSPNVMRLHLVPYADHPPHLDIHLDDFWMSAYAYLKVRSQLRVPLKLHGRVIGGMAFTSSQPDLYSEDDVEFARRVADHLALAMAHSELAAEAARAADAQERAARLQDRVKVLVEELETKSSHRAIGRSKRWRDVLAHATKVAPTDTTVLITGESGTGKEVVARFIHRASKRAEGPFVALNCAALPEHLLESELFGHEKGAFTGAVAARAGRVEQAGGGVLFLDEVGEMSPSVQAKLLRVLQEREFQRLGGTRTQKADVRVLAATNRDLRASIATGGFREDLYYRLGVFEIPLPPLRERTDDILVLVEAFLTEIGASFGRPAAGLSEDAQQRLLAHAWPGNVRELRNAIERAMILCEGGLITSEHLPLAMTGPLAAPASAASSAPPSADGAPPWTFPAAGVDLEKIERDLVLKALAEAGNNRSKAAKLLGLNRGQLYSRLEKHGLR